MKKLHKASKVSLEYSLYETDNLSRAKIDSDYLGELIIHNSNLIYHCMWRYVGSPHVLAQNLDVGEDDLFQLGALGFIKSVNAFDISKGFKFPSFAVTSIVREIRCYIRDSVGIVRVSRSAQALLREIKNIEQKIGYIPCVTELAEILDTTTDKITKVLTVGCGVKYLEEATSSLETGTHENPLLNLQDPMDIETECASSLYVANLLYSIKDKLSDDEVLILQAYFIDDKLKTAIAVEIGITVVAVSAAVKKITQLLKDVIANQM